MNKNTLIFLIAPNAGEQMGGEAMKALQIFKQYRMIHSNTIQIVHERNKAELSNRLNLDNVYYVKDDWISIFIWKSIVFRKFIDVWFSRKAVYLAEKIAEKTNNPKNRVIIHQTEPNSPVAPRALSRKFLNVFGPINGNIYYPKIFRYNETTLVKFRRLLHFPLQRVNSWLPKGIKNADMIFVAGGNRTIDSLKAGGCSDDIFVETLDCGINDDFLDRKRVEHRGINYRFIHFGRLVFHKGTALIIKSLLKTRNQITLDIVGRGPELESCKRLAVNLGLESRVNFLGWYTKHDDLFDSFHSYRGVVLPSIEDANGIVIQEALALGLPAICLDWGGPQLLIEHGVNGYLIQPSSEEHITDKIAEYMDTLAENGELAERFSLAGRQQSSIWRWSAVSQAWLRHYDRLTRKIL